MYEHWKSNSIHVIIVVSYTTVVINLALSLMCFNVRNFKAYLSRHFAKYYKLPVICIFVLHQNCVILK